MPGLFSAPTTGTTSMAEQYSELVSDADLAGVSGGTDDQGDQSNWLHSNCPKCGSTKLTVELVGGFIPTFQRCVDCGYSWVVMGPG